MLISIIIPVYNEEKNLIELYLKLSKVLSNYVSYELIFVNDGSKDLSINMIKELASKDSQVKYIDFSRNFGHQIAVMAGLQYCRGNAAVIIDADLQDPPELIIDLYKKYLEGYQVVYAKRKIRQGETFLKKFTAKIFYRMLKSITNIDIPLDTGDFRIIDRKIIDVLKSMPEQNKFLRGQIAWAGYKQTYVEYERGQRFAGETGYTYSKMLRFAMDGITAFSDLPLKLATIAGFSVSFVAFLIMLYTLYTKFYSHDYVPGWPSTMISILFIGGIQLIGIGIIGEYVSRMSSNIRQRPLFVVQDTNVNEIKTENQVLI